MATNRYKVLNVETNGVDLEFQEELDLKAPNIFFDNTAAPFLADSVQDAIVEAKGVSGKILAADFTGNPKKYTVTFTTAFVDDNYSVSIVGADGRAWIVEAQTASGFTINSQARALLTGPVQWTAVYNL